MAGSTKPRLPAVLRAGDPLRVGREPVSYGRNILLQRGNTYELQQRLFVNDPWELMAEAIARAVPPSKTRDIAQSFLRQAEDYFQAATASRELAVRPVLLYYAFLNLSKAYGVSKGNDSLTGSAYHGISSESKPATIPKSLIKFSLGRGTLIFQGLLNHLGGDSAVLSVPLRLGHLLPQILPGHRLWCYATNRSERFITIEDSEVLHSSSTKEVWLNLYLNRSDLERINISEGNVLSQANLSNFEIAVGQFQSHFICYQQRVPDSYVIHPAEALTQIITRTKNNIWETVRTASPYRKPYIYCCPPAEQRSRLPQLLSIYLLMFFLGSVTRYSPGDFEDLLDSKYGPFLAPSSLSLLHSSYISWPPISWHEKSASLRLSDRVNRAA